MPHPLGWPKLPKALHLRMFIRKKKNRSGTTSIVVVEKRKGIYREIKTIGTSSDASEIGYLWFQGKKWISRHIGEQDVFEVHDRALEESQVTEYLLSNVENILLNRVQLILNRVFKLTGFDAVEDDILRQLAIARISQPMSKAATVEYLKSHFDEGAQLHLIYRYLDKLYNTQVVLGLLVSKDGYPLSYSVFNGSQYEGRTMLPVVEDFVHRFNLDDFIVVADSGLMNQKHITLLESGNYKYIIGAKIKNESNEIKKWALSLSKQDGGFYETKKGTARLIIGYSDNRAKKDRHNRDKGVKRLQQAYKSGKITKENINKKGYNKFLDISDNVKVSIDHEKIEETKNGMD